MTLLPPSTDATATTEENFHWLTAEEEREVFDQHVRELLGISGEEFLAHLHAGRYNEALRDPDDPRNLDLTYLAMFAQVVR